MGLWLNCQLGHRVFRILPRRAANRLGHGAYTTAELKTIQEVITLTVFAGFSILVMREPLTLNHAIGFALIAAGAYFIFRGPL